MNGDRLFVLQVPIITAFRDFCCIFYITPERFYFSAIPVVTTQASDTILSFKLLHDLLFILSR
jgi:hypothetical protein